MLNCNVVSEIIEDMLPEEREFKVVFRHPGLDEYKPVKEYSKNNISIIIFSKKDEPTKHLSFVKTNKEKNANNPNKILEI